MSGRRELRQAGEPEIGRFSALITDAEAVAQTLPPDSIPGALGQLARLEARLTARMVAAAKGSPEPDRLLSAPQAADLLDLSPDTLYRKARSFPFTILLPGRQVRFSALGIERYIRSKQGRF